MILYGKALQFEALLFLTEGGIMSAVNRDRMAKVLATPKEVYLQGVRNFLLAYRGRLAVTMRSRPKVTILARVELACHVNNNGEDCVVMMINMDRSPLRVSFYPEDIRNYYLFGFRLDEMHAKSVNAHGDDCPSSVRLMD